MRDLPLFCWRSIALVILLLGGRAFGQGCGLAVLPVDFEHECYGTDVPESTCEGQGNPSYYCYIGSGECSQDGYIYTSTNVAPDPSCGGGGSGGCRFQPFNFSKLKFSRYYNTPRLHKTTTPIISTTPLRLFTSTTRQTGVFLS